MNPIFFDAGFYLSQNPDVAAAVAAGTFANAFAHFTQFGQFENRDPNSFFDVSFYLESNPDVADAIANGTATSAYSHFVAFGQFEERDPDADFDSDYYLAENPDVAAAVANGTIPSAFAHFLQFGQFEGVVRAPNATFATFDEAAYLEANPDVAAAVEAGIFPNAFAHFLEFGRNENRPGTPETEPTEPPVTPPPGGGDNTPPQVTLSEPTVGDDSLDADELNGNVVVSGTFTGTLGANETIVVRVGEAEFIATVISGSPAGTFTASVPGSALFSDRGTPVPVSVFATDTAGNETASVEGDYVITAQARLESAADDTLFFDLLTDALANAPADATITTLSGATIVGDVEVSSSGLSLIGPNADLALGADSLPETTITGGVSITATASGTSVSGLVVDGTLANPTAEGSTFFVAANNVSITDNQISGAAAGALAGIVTVGDVGGLIVRGNSFDGFSQFGIYVNPSDNAGAQISGNTFDGLSRIPIVLELGPDGLGGFADNNTFEETTNDARNGDIVVVNRSGVPALDANNFVGTGNDYSTDTGIQVRILAAGDSVTTGTANNDLIVVNFDTSLDAIIDGGAGNDTIVGGSGSDTIDGGSGNDTITGGVEADTLTGGLGSDTFIFASGDTGITFTTIDTITDFTSGVGGDVIEFTASPDGSAENFVTGTFDGSVDETGGFDAALASANALFGADPLVTYAFVTNGDDGFLFIDNDGSSGADAAIRLVGVTTLTAADIDGFVGP